MPIGVRGAFPTRPGRSSAAGGGGCVGGYFTHMPRPDFPAKVDDWPKGDKPGRRPLLIVPSRMRGSRYPAGYWSCGHSAIADEVCRRVAPQRSLQRSTLSITDIARKATCRPRLHAANRPSATASNRTWPGRNTRNSVRVLVSDRAALPRWAFRPYVHKTKEARGATPDFFRMLPHGGPVQFRRSDQAAALLELIHSSGGASR